MVQMLTPVRDHGNVKMISSTTSSPKCIKIPQSKLGVWGGGGGGRGDIKWGVGSLQQDYILHEKMLTILLMIVKSLREQYLSAFLVPSGVVIFFNSFFFIVFFCRSYILYHKFYLRYLLYFFIILNLSLAFFEKPALKGASLPFWVCPVLIRNPNFEFDSW